MPSPRRTTDDHPPRQLRLEAPTTLDLEAANEGGATLPRFRMVAYTGTPMRVAGWRHSVVIDLAGLSISSQSRPIRFGHDPLSGVGHTDAVRVEDGQLVATGLVSRDTPAAREVVTSARNGFPWQASVGAGVEEFEVVKDNQQVLVNSRTFTGPLNIVRKATLGEISFVDLGADGRTSASVAAEQRLDAGDRRPEEDTDEPSDLQPTVSSLRSAAIAETNRITAVRRVCAGRFPEIESQAIRDCWDAMRTELEVLRSTRPRSPGIGSGDGGVSGAVLEAACLLTAKLDGVERLYPEQTLDLASRRFRGGNGLQELLLEAAWAKRYTGRNFRDHRTVLRYAFGRGIEAEFSTVDIGGILSNVANKFLLDGFFSVERTWRNVCAVRNVSDFKTVTSYRLIGKDQYELVAPGGEIKHGSIKEMTYPFRVDTFAKMLSLDRRDVVNDDLSLFDEAARNLGRAAMRSLSDLVFQVLLANAGNFFSGGHANYDTGPATALSSASLGAGIAKMISPSDFCLV
jgi:hypothetical protein